MRYDAFSRYHPVTNFTFFLGAICFAVVVQHPAYIAVSVFCAGIYYLMLWGRKGLKLILGLIPVFAVIAAVNPLLGGYGEHVLFTLFGSPYSWEALCYGMAVAGIFVAMILWFGCYSAVLTSDKFVCLFGSLIPSLSLLLVMVLRMLPNLLRKAKQLSGARKCIGKGAGERTTTREKLSDSMNLISALTDWALEGSIVTADSMRARGYGVAKRTGFQIYRLTAWDGVLLAFQLVLVLAVLSFGGTEASFSPVLAFAQPNWGLAFYGAYLLIPPALYLKEAVTWHISVSRI